MLKQKYEQVKKFVVDHKKEIAVCVVTVVSGVVVYKLIKSVTTEINSAEKVILDMADSNVIKNLDIPELGVGTINDLWVDDYGKNLILNDITVGDMGKIGEEFLKIDGITKDTVVSAVIGLLDSVNEVTEF